MNFTNLSIYLSAPRYNRYLNAVGNNNSRAKRLYNANIRLAQAFHPVISQFEVILRNAIDNSLTIYFTDPNWIINQKVGFMSDNSLRQSRYFLRESIVKTERNLLRKGVPITSGKLISDQNFGFWISFFVAHHYGLLSGSVLNIFPAKPPHITRSNIYGKLDSLREFRNRVNHCEPLCFDGNAINCTHALEIVNTIYDLLQWMNPTIIPFINSLDNITSKINQINNI